MIKNPSENSFQVSYQQNFLPSDLHSNSLRLMPLLENVGWKCKSAFCLCVGNQFLNDPNSSIPPYAWHVYIYASWCAIALSRFFCLPPRHEICQILFYSRTSMARTLMARLPWLFWTRSWVLWKKNPWLQSDFLFYTENGILCVLTTHNIPSCYRKSIIYSYYASWSSAIINTL